MPADNFDSLFLALQDHFSNFFHELPTVLQERVAQDWFFFGSGGEGPDAEADESRTKSTAASWWDSRTPAVRRRIADEWDAENDPANLTAQQEAMDDYLWRDRRDELLERLRVLENLTAQTSESIFEVEKRDRLIWECRQDIRLIDERYRQITYIDDAHFQRRIRLELETPAHLSIESEQGAPVEDDQQSLPKGGHGDRKRKGVKQEEAVLEAIKAKGLDPMCIPDGGKTELANDVKLTHPDLFSAETAFKETWKRLRGEGSRVARVRMENHDSFVYRGNG